MSFLLDASLKAFQDISRLHWDVPEMGIELSCKVDFAWNGMIISSNLLEMPLLIITRYVLQPYMRLNNLS